jgi:antitoxin HigA-1
LIVGKTGHKSTTMRDFPPIHPGEILQEEFLEPMGISQERLAQDIGVPLAEIGKIIGGETSVNADIANRLAQYFGTSTAVWLRLQTRYDLEAAEWQMNRGYEKKPLTADELNIWQNEQIWEPPNEKLCASLSPFSAK